QGQGALHFFFIEQAHGHAGFAEQEARLLLVVQDALHVLRGQMAGVDQQGTDGWQRFPARNADLQVGPVGQGENLRVHARLLRGASASRRDAGGRRGTKAEAAAGMVARIGNRVTAVRSSTERIRRLSSSSSNTVANASTRPPTAATSSESTGDSPLGSSGSTADARRITLVWLARLCRCDCAALALTAS